MQSPTPYSAPHFAELLQKAQAQPILTKKNEIALFKQILEQIQRLTVCGVDSYRHFWFYMDRGKISDYGSFTKYKREGIVSAKADFEDLWRGDYPEEKHWYQFESNEYNGNYYFYIDGNLTLQISPEKPDYYRVLDNSRLLNALLETATNYVDWIAAKNDDYNRFLNENLSFFRRKGKILRSKYWEINPHDKKVITKGLTKKDIAVLQKIVEQSQDDFPLPKIEKITSGEFFEMCRLGYQANGYLKNNPDMSGFEAYCAYADGRDEGLTEIAQNSPEAFAKWYNNSKRGGGHPWEVLRGGNSTHISLFVSHNYSDNGSWRISLAGSSSMRVNETVKFAIALYNSNIAFTLRDADEILAMVTGTDYIGIVPQEFTPRYCHSLFEDEEINIIDFMNLDWEDTDKIIAATEWYPVEIK